MAEAEPCELLVHVVSVGPITLPLELGFIARTAVDKPLTIPNARLVPLGADADCLADSLRSRSATSASASLHEGEG